MHVSDEQVHAAIVVVVEKLNPHCSPRSAREILGRLVHENLPCFVLVIRITPLHVKKINAGPARAIQIAEARIAAPAVRMQSHFRCDVLKMVVSKILVQDGMLETLGMEMAKKAVFKGNILAIGALSIVGVHADIADEKIEESIVIVIEEERSRGMGHQAEAGFFGNIMEVAVAIVLEEDVAAANRGDKQILAAIVINIGKRRAHADASRQTDAGLLCDVLELAAAEIFP